MTGKPADDPAAAWQAFAASLAAAGTRMSEATCSLSPEERADGFRALARALANQLGRLEADDAKPELAPFNLWRQKFYMDNPDCLYWVAEIAKGGRYRIRGTAKGAVFASVNVYAGSSLETQTVARITSDDLALDAEGRFTLTLGGDEAGAEGQWLAIPDGANMIWVRQFFDDPASMDGTCTIDRIDAVPAPPIIQPARFARRLAGMGATLDTASRVMVRAGSEKDTEPKNGIREWSEMQGGAVYTEPGIHYQRGAWQLSEGEALVLEGPMVEARHFSTLLYSRFLNSLDYRSRTVSLTRPRMHVEANGNFRIVIAGEDPGVPNWLDTEGRPFGLFVIRWLQPSAVPVLPTAQCVPIARLKG